MVKAVNLTTVKQVCIAGGVSANSGLRNALTSIGQQKGWKVYIPDFSYCTDNAAMIAITGYHKYLNNQFVSLSVNPSARAEW